jgi:hypothetical protein
MSYDQLLKKTAKLKQYIKIASGDETDQYWSDFLDLACYSTYLMSDEFSAAYNKELDHILEDIKNNYVIVETEIVPTKTYTQQILAYKDNVDDYIEENSKIVEID